MALNGINFPLSITGQNAVWNKVYKQVGFSKEELKDFFSGPAYFNWFWMGNLDGWGGPLPESFMKRQEALVIGYETHITGIYRTRTASIQ